MRCVYILSVVIFALIAGAFGADCEFGGKSLKKGETFQKPGECSIYTCEGPGSISGKTCPAEPPVKGCELIAEDSSKPFPECCAHHKC